MIACAQPVSAQGSVNCGRDYLVRLATFRERFVHGLRLGLRRKASPRRVFRGRQGARRDRQLD